MVLLGIQNTTLAVTAVITGAVLVFAALLIARLIGPRSFTQKKGETYECGIPTRGESMAQFHVGYYLFAILFLNGPPLTVQAPQAITYLGSAICS